MYVVWTYNATLYLYTQQFAGLAYQFPYSQTYSFTQQFLAILGHPN
jgi:hypothetical protein